jgi:hypothetical protein
VTAFHDGFERSFTIGVRQTSAKYWRDVLQLCLVRIEAGQRQLVPFDPEHRDINKALLMAAVSSQQAADVHFALVAIRNILRLMEEKLSTCADSRLLELEAEFRQSFPDAWDLRDILEHLLDYEGGEGKLQRRGTMPKNESMPNLIYGSTTDPEAEVVLLFNFKARNIRVKEALGKAIEIADCLSALED